MKYLSMIFAAGIVLVSITPLSTMAETLLTASQVQELFADKTMTVTNGRPDDKKGGHEEPFKVYTSNMGIAKTVYDDESSQTRAWHVSDDGRLCFSRSLSRRRQGTTCGYIIKDENQYLLYTSKDIKEKNGKVVGVSKKDLLIIFSDFKSGNMLQ